MRYRAQAVRLPLTPLLLALVASCSDNARLLDAAVDLPLIVEDSALEDLSVATPDVAAVDVAPLDALGPDAGASARSFGATVDEGGVTFRVWAPGAMSAQVSGDFGDQSLRPEDGGVFSARVEGARAGQGYRFILTRGEQTLTRVDPRARATADGGAVVLDPGAYRWRTTAFTPPPRREAVIYELHVGSFAPQSGARNGTFADVTARLDGLADLGVNVLELMPVHEFGGAAWGYNPKLWLAANAAYGSPDELRRLVDEAHARGIAVLLDVVYNHYDGGSRAPMRCFDGDCPDGGPGVYFFNDVRYRNTPWGPRPDFARAEVASLLLDGVATWLDEYRVDGFRWDSVSNIRAIDGMGEVPGGRDLLVRANALSRRLRPGALLIAEDLKGWGGITQAAPAGLGFDAQWDGFVYTLGDVLSGASDDARSLAAVRDAMLGRYNNDPFQRVIGTENHDTVGNGGARLPQRIDAADPGSFAARKRSMLAAALMMTAPGVPMLFMGQEHLERGTFASTPAPLDWSREAGFARVRAFYRALIRARRNLDGATPGLLGANVSVIHFHEANKVLAVRRWDRGGDDVVVIANLRNRAYARYDIGLPSGGTWDVRIDSDDPRWSEDFHGRAAGTVTALAQPYDGQPFTGPIALGPWSVVVLSRR